MIAGKTKIIYIYKHLRPVNPPNVPKANYRSFGLRILLLFLSPKSQILTTQNSLPTVFRINIICFDRLQNLNYGGRSLQVSRAPPPCALSGCAFGPRNRRQILRSISLSISLNFLNSLNRLIILLLDNLYHFDHFIIRNSDAFLFIVTDMSE